MTTKFSRFTAQDQLDAAGHFEFSISTDPEVVAERAANRGTGANIANDQSTGAIVGAQVLGDLKAPEHQIAWAQLYSGAMLNAALYALREADKKTTNPNVIPPMSRSFALPGIVSQEGHLPESGLLKASTFWSLGNLVESCVDVELDLVLAKPNKQRIPTRQKVSRLGRQLGNTSMIVSIYGTEFFEADGPTKIRKQVWESAVNMHKSTQILAGRIGVNPSLAQLRTESTPLGVHIIREYPTEIAGAFRKAVHDVNGRLGY